MREPVLRVLSLGAGVQSTAILVLVGLAKTRSTAELADIISRDVDARTYDRLRGIDCAIFADTGWEPHARWFCPKSASMRTVYG